MTIRTYKEQDCMALIELFRQTVHSVNARDYSSEQLAAWAPESIDSKRWNCQFLSGVTLVATEPDQTIVGFGNIEPTTGHLDKLYIHKDYQRQGIATALCNLLEASVTSLGSLSVHASITARPFFEQRDYRVVRTCHVKRNGIGMTNYLMTKMLFQ